MTLGRLKRFATTGTTRQHGFLSPSSLLTPLKILVLWSVKKQFLDIMAMKREADFFEIEEVDQANNLTATYTKSPANTAGERIDVVVRSHCNCIWNSS